MLTTQRIARACTWALLLGVVPACATARTDVEPLRYFDACTATATPDVKTRACGVTELPSDRPAMVPYAVVNAVGTKSSSGIRQQIFGRIQLLKWPDLIVFEDRGQIATGSISTHYGWGIWGNQTTYANQVQALAFRLAPVSLGIEIDDNRMVVALSDPARASGITEGDTVVTVGGKRWERGERWYASPHFELLLEGTPGERVPLVWIRQGTGRMEGEIELQPNHRGALDEIDLAAETFQYTPKAGRTRLY